MGCRHSSLATKQVRRRLADETLEKKRAYVGFGQAKNQKASPLN